MEELVEELEVLAAIYGDDFVDTSQTGTSQCSICVQAVSLSFVFPLKYPSVVAAVSAQDVSHECFDHAVQSRLDALESVLTEKMGVLVGAPLVYETTLAAQEWLEQHPLCEWKSMPPSIEQGGSTKAKVCVLMYSAKTSGRANGQSLGIPLAHSDPAAVPSLQSMCMLCMLHRAEQYDTDSRAIIAESLEFFCEVSSGLTLLVSLIENSEAADVVLLSGGLLAFAGIGQYPSLCDWVRQQLSARPMLGRKLLGAVHAQCLALEEHHADAEARNKLCADVDAVLNWMIGIDRCALLFFVSLSATDHDRIRLGHGRSLCCRYKREMKPPLLTKEQGDLARKTKKLLRQLCSSKQGNGNRACFGRAPSEWASHHRQRQFGIYVTAHHTHQSWRKGK
jgi:hypothetical protein